VTDTARYSDWRRARFPGSVETRANASLPYFTPDVATAADRDYIAERVAEDRKVFDLIAAALARSGKDSIRGRELVG
jgi:hypothetical protein